MERVIITLLSYSGRVISLNVFVHARFACVTKLFNPYDIAIEFLVPSLGYIIAVTINKSLYFNI